MSIAISARPSSSYIDALRNASLQAASRPERTSTSSNASEAESTTVSLSAAATQAAKSAASERLKLPNADLWIRTEFSDEILAEAKARLAERQASPGIGDGYLPSSVANLPLLPENQALLNQFRQEMKAIGHANTDPAMNARFNQLLNLSMRLQLEGWKAPMTESDIQREFDIQLAMGTLDTETATPATGNDAFTDPFAGWKARWQQEGVKMPETEQTTGRSFWMDLANRAGVDDDTFVAKARELASQFKGNALTQAIEHFISDRYTAMQGHAAAA